MEDTYITINSYHELMCEALSSLRSGLACFSEAEKREEEDPGKDWLYRDSQILCRFAFLMAATALEAAANALLLDLKTSYALYEDFERLSIVLKYEVVCMAHGKNIDRGNDVYGRAY